MAKLNEGLADDQLNAISGEPSAAILTMAMA
jgi:hypothetical protein